MTVDFAGEIKRFFRDTSWWLRVPRRLRDRRLELYRTADELTQDLGRAPTVAELARRLGLEEEEVLEGLDACASYTTSSLDATQFPDDDTQTVADQLGGDDVRLDLIEYRQDLGPALEEPPPREREIVLLRFLRQHEPVADRGTRRNLADACIAAAQPLVAAPAGTAGSRQLSGLSS